MSGSSVTVGTSVQVPPLSVATSSSRAPAGAPLAHLLPLPTAKAWKVTGGLHGRIEVSELFCWPSERKAPTRFGEPVVASSWHAVRTAGAKLVPPATRRDFSALTTSRTPSWSLSAVGDTRVAVALVGSRSSAEAPLSN